MGDWAVPEHSRTEVDAAGVILARGPGDDEMHWDDALALINNWRSSHNFPLNTFQIGLRRRANDVDPRSLVSQRIKRLPAIRHKLERLKWLKLSEVQDIGGCRAVLSSVPKVRRLVREYKKSDIKHKLDHIDDYIEEPKRSGYRSVHLIYRYYSDRKETYNGLKIEIQVRSQLQHSWATAVEIVGMFIQEALKSSQGQKEWLRFFQLMGSVIALNEKNPPVPDTPSNKSELKKELKHYADLLGVQQHLSVYGAALQTLEEVNVKGAHYFLLELDPEARAVKVTGYKPAELEKASSDYLAVEKAITEQGGKDAVLVSVESITSLRRAYPNYFLDLHNFIGLVNRALP